MNVKLSAEHERLVNQLVKHGHYENANAVFAKALELLQEREQQNGVGAELPVQSTIRDALGEILQRASESEKQALRDLPRDFAAEHDHYVYGTRKRYL